MVSGQFSKALICQVIYLRTDKDFYYADEVIEIEASWDFDYVEDDDPYFQIRIYDELDSLLWNSSEFDGKGVFEENWTIIIRNLNLNFNYYSNIISIKAVYFNEFNGGDMELIILEALYLTIFKRNLACELFNFTEKVILGKNLSFNAHFYSDNTNSNLSGHDINFYILSNNSMIYQKTYTSNDYGIISLYLSSINDMRLGINKLIFNVSNGIIYNRTVFYYEIVVEKTPIYIDILKYNNKFRGSEQIELELFFYYFNESIVPLRNEPIRVMIYDNLGIKYQKIFNIDTFGFLKINISSPIYEINQEDYRFYLQLVYNGSKLLNYKILVLNFEMLTVSLPNYNSLISLLVILMGSVFIIIVIANYIYHYKKKKPRFKKVNEIFFKF